MKTIVLDTNFILTCIRNKLDFFDGFKFNGLRMLIPKQVLQEIKRISESRKKLRFKEEAKLALKLLEQNSFKEIDLKSKNVDNGIVKFTKVHKGIIVATLDKELQARIQNPKMIIRNKKRLEII